MNQEKIGKFIAELVIGALLFVPYFLKYYKIEIKLK